ncbi:MAG: hypothetical protein RLZZ165_383, partial [Bacteroidota bacterium]
AEVARTLRSLAPVPVVRTVIAAGSGGFGNRTAMWRSLLDGLRRVFPGILLSVGGRVEALDATGSGAISDELAIDYPPIAEAELRSPSRIIQRKISTLAGQLHKPVFLFRANLIGDEPLPQFKNRLRFWLPEAAISGLCLNTLYPKSPLRDGTSYYGLADDPDVLGYLDGYLPRPQESAEPGLPTESDNP